MRQRNREEDQVFHLDIKKPEEISAKIIKILKEKGKRRKAESRWVAVNVGKLDEKLWGTVREKAGRTAPLEVEEKQLSSTCCSS